MPCTHFLQMPAYGWPPPLALKPKRPPLSPLHRAHEVLINTSFPEPEGEGRAQVLRHPRLCRVPIPHRLCSLGYPEPAGCVSQVKLVQGCPGHTCKRQAVGSASSVVQAALLSKFLQTHDLSTVKTHSGSVPWVGSAGRHSRPALSNSSPRSGQGGRQIQTCTGPTSCHQRDPRASPSPVGTLPFTSHCPFSSLGGSTG